MASTCRSWSRDDRDADLDEATADRRRAVHRGTERYGARIEAFRAVAAKRSGKAAPPELVVRAIEHALTSDRPKTGTSSAATRRSERRSSACPTGYATAFSRRRCSTAERRLRFRHGRLDDGLPADAPPLLRRAETYFPDKQIVTRLPDKSFHRYTYRDCCRRSRQLAVALKNLGLERGDRVATLAWNHYQHMECYLGIPCGGFVLHTLNLRLHPSDLAYIATHAGDKAVVVDRCCCRCSTSSRTTRRSSTFSSSRTRTRICWPRRTRTTGGPRARRERGGGHVLHERHDGRVQGRRLLAPLDDPPHARRRLRRAARASAVGVRHVPAGGADVPRERVGLPVPRDDDGREHRLPGPAPRRREPARRVRAGAGDVDGGRADDLARHPRAARRESRQVGSPGSRACSAAARRRRGR